MPRGEACGRHASETSGKKGRPHSSTVRSGCQGPYLKSGSESKTITSLTHCGSTFPPLHPHFSFISSHSLCFLLPHAALSPPHTLNTSAKSYFFHSFCLSHVYDLNMWCPLKLQQQKINLGQWLSIVRFDKKKPFIKKKQSSIYFQFLIGVSADYELLNKNGNV